MGLVPIACNQWFSSEEARQSCSRAEAFFKKKIKSLQSLNSSKDQSMEMQVQMPCGLVGESPDCSLACN